MKIKDDETPLFRENQTMDENRYKTSISEPSKSPLSKHPKYSEEDIAKQLWARYIDLIKNSSETRIIDHCREADLPYKTMANQKAANKLPKLITLLAMATEVGTSLDYLVLGKDRGLRNEMEQEIILKLRQRQDLLEAFYFLSSFPAKEFHDFWKSLVAMMNLVSSSKSRPSGEKAKYKFD